MNQARLPTTLIAAIFAVFAAICIGCSTTQSSSDLSSRSGNLPMILDIDCSSEIADAAITSVRGRVRRIASAPDTLTGAISLSNTNLTSSVAPAQSGSYSGKLHENGNELTIELTPDDERNSVRSIKVSSGQAASKLAMTALPEIGLKCLVSRFSGAATSKIFPTCNGEGTVTAGWYIDGKLVNHDPECGNKVTACVSGSSSAKFGWQMFAKTNRRAVSLTRCASDRKLPVCDGAGTPLQGWYTEGKLISADGQCHLRGISCEELGSKREGWYTHERMPIKFLLAADCKGVERQYAMIPALNSPKNQKTALKTDDQSR